MNTNLFINGEFKETEEKQKIINPSSGEVIAKVSVASQNEAKAALEAARLAFDKGPWPRLSFDERKNILLKVSEGILEKAGELALLETQNTGKPIKESTFMDIPSSAKAFECMAHNFKRYLEEESPALEAEAHCKLLREPMGVVVLIVPWNYPLLIACWKLSQALAAGNAVILKPSSLTPLTALALADIFHKAGLPEGAANIVNGSGETLGKLLCSDSRTDMVSFTGSNAVGKEIIQYTSQGAKKLIMELGGKSASIVLSEADFEVAVNSSLCSIFLNQGQMCTAMSRILVQEDIYARFVEAFTAKAKRIKLGPGQDFESQMGPLISKAQRNKVIDFVEKSKKEGAKLACGGRIPSAPGLKNGFFFEPAVFVDVDPRMSIFKEEVFGPVACISKFSTAQEAVALANASEFGLAACIFSKNETEAMALAAQLNAGTVWVNTYGMFYPEAPYGGFKQSGFGKELGREGFLEYTRLKNIIIDTTRDSKPLVNYWYGF